MKYKKITKKEKAKLSRLHGKLVDLAAETINRRKLSLNEVIELHDTDEDDPLCRIRDANFYLGHV